MREIDLKLVIPTRHDAFCPPRAAPPALIDGGAQVFVLIFQTKTIFYCFVDDLLIVKISELTGFCSFVYILTRRLNYK